MSIDNMYIDGKKRYDGTIESLADRFHRPKSHPKQHTQEEIKMIKKHAPA